MRKLKLYIETSTWNFIFADDAPEKKAITKAFFDVLVKGHYDIYVSNIVLLEVSKASVVVRERLEDLINKYKPQMLESSVETKVLAELYIKRGVIPAAKVEDALHVAIASVAEMDALITWNFKHLANLKKTEYFYSINIEQGYWKKLEIVTPMEVMSDEI